MKIFKKLMTLLLIAAFALPAFAATDLLPSKHHSGFWVNRERRGMRPILITTT